jgi:hypothetical protein
LAYTARFGNSRLGSVAHDRDGLTRQHELPQINGYPFHPSEQDIISAAGIKHQQLTIIVSMMLACPPNGFCADHSAIYRLIAGVRRR